MIYQVSRKKVFYNNNLIVNIHIVRYKTFSNLINQNNKYIYSIRRYENKQFKIELQELKNSLKEEFLFRLKNSFAFLYVLIMSPGLSSDLLNHLSFNLLTCVVVASINTNSILSSFFILSLHTSLEHISFTILLNIS